MLAAHHLLVENTLWGEVFVTLVWWIMLRPVVLVHPDYQNPWRYRLCVVVHSVPLLMSVALYLVSPLRFVPSHSLSHVLVIWVYTIRHYDVCVRIQQVPYHFCDWNKPMRAFIVTWILVAICVSGHLLLWKVTESIIFSQPATDNSVSDL